MVLRPFRVGIIPLREMEGNYNPKAYTATNGIIIPLREMEGNYNSKDDIESVCNIIPLREMEGNYNYFVFL